MDKLPKGWRKTTIGDVCNKVTDGTHKTPHYTENGVPFLSVKDVTKGFIDFSNTRFISKTEHEELTRRCKPEINDLLYFQ
jgi:type I restriction enzyme, S subunit